ncbi:MAG: Trp family transcriptional regulator [Spirochaetia bacterium]
MENRLHWNEDQPLRELSAALAFCDDPVMIDNFLAALFTDAEVREMGKRWALVRLLEDGMSQRQIAKNLSLSLCKITRGSKELKKRDSAFRKMIELYKIRGPK